MANTTRTRDKAVTAERLSTALHRRGITQQELADRVGIHRNSTNNYARGKTRPIPVVLAAMAAELDVPVTYLTGETDDLT